MLLNQAGGKRGAVGLAEINQQERILK